MNTLIISYSNHLDEGRLKELIAVTKQYGKPIILISSNIESTDDNVVCIKKKANSHIDYIHFTYQALKFAIKNREKYQVVLLDFMTSVLPGILLSNFLKDKFFVQDVRELAFPKDFEKIPGKLLSFLEGRMVKKANVVIAANIYRAKMMKDYYKIEQPFSFENIRLLGPLMTVTDSESSVISNGKFKIISTGGPSISRGIISILENFKELPDFFELTLVGDTGEADFHQVTKFLAENNMKNVNLLKRVESKDLYELVKNSHVGIVHYHFDDLNNIYCASGKIYEYLGCLIPIVATENPPLKDFCEQHKIGVANNNFKVSLTEIYENYSFYKMNVIKQASNIDVENNNNELANHIVSEYEKWSAK